MWFLLFYFISHLKRLSLLFTRFRTASRSSLFTLQPVVHLSRTYIICLKGRDSTSPVTSYDVLRAGKALRQWHHTTCYGQGSSLPVTLYVVLREGEAVCQWHHMTFYGQLKQFSNDIICRDKGRGSSLPVIYGVLREAEAVCQWYMTC